MDNYDSDKPLGVKQDVLRALAHARTQKPMENSVRASILGTILEALVRRNLELTRIPWAEENSLLDLAHAARRGCVAEDGNHIGFENLVLSELKTVFGQIGQALQTDPDINAHDRRIAENVLRAAMDFNAATGPRERRHIDPQLRQTDWHTPLTALCLANEIIALVIPRTDKEFLKTVQEDFASIKILNTDIYCEGIRERFMYAHDFTDHAKLNSAHTHLEKLQSDLDRLCAAQVVQRNGEPQMDELDFSSLNQLLYYLQNFDPRMGEEKQADAPADDNVISLSERRQEAARREIRRLFL